MGFTFVMDLGFEKETDWRDNCDTIGYAAGGNPPS